VRVRRVRLPDWSHSEYDPGGPSDDIVVFETLLLAPLYWFVFPLVRIVVLLPLAFASSAFSSTRWVVAQSRWPSATSIEWQTTRERAPAAAEEIADALARGREGIVPAGTKLVSRR